MLDHHQLASKTPFMVFRWRADGGPLIVVFGSPPLINKKNVVKYSDKMVWIPIWLLIRKRTIWQILTKLHYVKRCTLMHQSFVTKYTPPPSQGSHKLKKVKFPDFSLTFPWPDSNFPDPKYRHLSSFVGNLWTWLVNKQQFQAYVPV